MEMRNRRIGSHRKILQERKLLLHCRRASSGSVSIQRRQNQKTTGSKCNCFLKKKKKNFFLKTQKTSKLKKLKIRPEFKSQAKKTSIISWQSATQPPNSIYSIITEC